MGFFDFLKKKDPVPTGAVADKKTPVADKKVAGPARVVGDKRAQTYDRIEALQQLAAMGTPEAAAALLKRFSFSIDPSITDQEEKEIAFQGIVTAGKDVVPAVADFCVKAEQLTWPLKVLRELLDDTQFQDELLKLLDLYDTEYARNVEPKIQVISALEEVVSPDVRGAVEPFLEDVNETVRFHAVQTLFAQNDDACVPALVQMLSTEESVRIKNKVAEGLLFRGWAIPEELRAKASEALRDAGGYTVGRDGKIIKGAGYR